MSADDKSAFGAEVGVIMRADMPPLRKLVAVAVRYHEPDGAPAPVVAKRTGLARSTAYAQLGELKADGQAEDVAGQWFMCPPYGQSVSATRTRLSAIRTGGVRNTDKPVRNTDNPPHPPNRSSRPSPDLLQTAAAAAREATPTTAGSHDTRIRELVDAWWATQPGPGGSRAKSTFPTDAATRLIVELSAAGVDRVRWAIDRASEIAKGTPTAALLRKLVAEGPKATTAPMGETSKPGQYRNPDGPAMMRKAEKW